MLMPARPAKPQPSGFIARILWALFGDEPMTVNSAGDPPGQGLDFDDPDWVEARRRQAGHPDTTLRGDSTSGWTR
jgi:hypothetical protein